MLNLADSPHHKSRRVGAACTPTEKRRLYVNAVSALREESCVIKTISLPSTFRKERAAKEKAIKLLERPFSELHLYVSHGVN